MGRATHSQVPNVRSPGLCRGRDEEDVMRQGSAVSDLPFVWLSRVAVANKIKMATERCVVVSGVRSVSRTHWVGEAPEAERLTA